MLLIKEKYEEKYYVSKEVFEAFKKFERIDMAFFKESECILKEMRKYFK